ncbi:hypothetical protein [Actinomadura rudentiformis]|uniref:Ricin B lectin domain-containing protein n=1 Tax=Actinomadura rudentiformis TaxID=359158 RepID=A0A6H9YFQ8_9ACTN|nr:hypothetical protein [Actinomadura rudentiformis]KAB2337917.1 hypothetical protein F8566_49265 [Actinomadura rudentiformis]
MPGRRRATRASRPGSGKGPSGRTVSLLVAAPAFFTIVVIIVSLVVAANRNPGSGRKPAPASPAPTPTPPPDGWYTVKPVTGQPHGNCVAVLQDNEGEPTVSQHRCDAEDKLQRIWLQSIDLRTYLIKVRTSPTAFWCTTLASPAERARLHVKPCDKREVRQRFVLEPVPGEQPATRPVFRLSPVATRSKGMCIGIDTAELSPHSTRHALHTPCAHAAVRGYTFTPALAPRNS